MHPESEHGLRVQLATALRERDEARERARVAEAAWAKAKFRALPEYAQDTMDAVLARADVAESQIDVSEKRRDAAESALAAANARAEKAEAKVRWYQTTDFAESLAAARRECEGLRAALSDLIQEMNFGGGCDGNDPSCDGCVAVEAARAALASPAAAPAAGRAKIVGNFMCDKCKVGDHGNHHPGYGGICLGCACEWLPPPEPVAPEKEIANLLGRGHVRNPREGEPGDAETYSSPAALLPRVLAALEIIDRQGTIGVTTLIRSLAAELRAYIAEREPAEKRIAELEGALRDALNAAHHHEQDGQHWICSEPFACEEECPCAKLAARAAKAKGEGR